MHDFSEFLDLELGPDGRFGYSNLSLYRLQANRYPFLVRGEWQISGTDPGEEGSEISGNAAVWDMAEFFVVRGYRRLGIGTAIAPGSVEALPRAMGGSCDGIE